MGRRADDGIRETARRSGEVVLTLAETKRLRRKVHEGKLARTPLIEAMLPAGVEPHRPRKATPPFSSMVRAETREACLGQNRREHEA